MRYYLVIVYLIYALLFIYLFIYVMRAVDDVKVNTKRINLSSSAYYTLSTRTASPYRVTLQHEVHIFMKM